MLASLLLATILEQHQLDNLNELQLTLFAVEVMFLSAALLLMLKEYLITYWNTKRNITETERKDRIIKGNWPVKQRTTTPAGAKTTIASCSPPHGTTSASAALCSTAPGSK